MIDRVSITIEEDGTITVRTPGISGENHKAAEEFLAALAALTGSSPDTVKHRQAHAHVVNGQKIHHSH